MTVVCIASGPSLCREDVKYCIDSGAIIYVVKECYVYAPSAKVLYAADSDWWDHKSGVPEFKGEKWTLDHAAAEKWDLNYIPYKTSLKWGRDGVLATGGNSGFQLVNLAEILDDPDRIILLGYDMGFTKGKNNKHWWESMPSLKRKSRYSNYTDWIKRFKEAVPYIKPKVLNASRETSLDCFEKVDLRDVL